MLNGKTSNILSKSGKIGHPRKQHLSKTHMSVFSKLSPSQLPAKAKQSLQLKEIKDAMGNVVFLFLLFFLVLVLRMQRMREHEELLYSFQQPFISIFNASSEPLFLNIVKLS